MIFPRVGRVKVRDTAPSMWTKSSLIMTAYVDDLGSAGPKAEATRECAILDQKVGFGEKPRKNLQLTQYVGMCYDAIGYLPPGALLYHIHNKDYVRSVVAKYKASKNLSELKPVMTPMAENLELFEGHDSPGDDAPRAREWIGSLLFAVRVDRLDCCVAVVYLGRKVTRWTKLQDRQLLRLMRYLDCTSEIVLECWAHPKDYKELCLVSEWDADHAGSEDTTKSTSGY